MKGRTLYDLLNNITIKEYTLETYVDGHPADSSVENLVMVESVRISGSMISATSNSLVSLSDI